MLRSYTFIHVGKDRQLRKLSWHQLKLYWKKTSAKIDYTSRKDRLILKYESFSGIKLTSENSFLKDYLNVTVHTKNVTWNKL